jgi:GMP synthase (glutamine-hydrolysing)
MNNIHAEKILILDFGSQYSQLIARRSREIGVYCELHHYDFSLEEIKQFNPKGIILSGGPDSVMVKNAPVIANEIFSLGIPVLGICYGMQLMASLLGGAVKAGKQREFGHTAVRITNSSSLLDELESSVESMLQVWMSHGDHVSELPLGFAAIAATDNVEIVAMAHEVQKLYGLQFHPEVTHTKQGNQILERFVKQICGCHATWYTENILTDMLQQVREQVGQEQVLMALSGGVDSSVVAALLHQAIGNQLTCVFVDTGLLRYQEAEQVMQTFSQHLKLKLIKIDAKEKFYAALARISDPEEKRKIIGRLFIEIFEQEGEKHQEMQWLAQGTIYSDVIESAGTGKGPAHVIKSHHNVGGLPENMKFKLLEPLRELFKDEVRKLGLALGLPKEMLYRHPFPGAGLGIRILGEVKAEYIPILQKADDIFIEELKKADYYDKVSQAFAVFLPIKTVAVMGDQRHYEYVIALRAVETIDFMTATWAALPYDLLAKVSSRICNEVPHVSRVVYDISSKPPATIEWE